MPLVIFAIFVGWFIFGDPAKAVANYWWADRPAPWEQVDGYYYPDNSDLTVYSTASDLLSLQGCRDWAYSLAAMNNDPFMTRGDYECGAGKQESSFGMNVYRITVQ